MDKLIFENFENGFREVILGQIRFGGIKKTKSEQNTLQIPGYKKNTWDFQGKISKNMDFGRLRQIRFGGIKQFKN